MIKRKERNKLQTQPQKRRKLSTISSNKPPKQEQNINNNCIIIYK